MIEAIIHGLILAFGLILPLGVQNVFVFNQGAIQPSFPKALPVIITASICDTFLITIAVLGISVFVLGSYWVKTLLFVAGIIFLIYMGIVVWRSKPIKIDQEKSSFSAKKQILFAMSVSLLNPHAILDTVGVIGTSSLKYMGTDKLAFAIACIFTSWLWFTGLGIAGRFIGSLNKSEKFLTVLNKVSAIIMLGTAVYIGSSFF